MSYDVIVVGGGIAGLTSAAYLCRSEHKMLICEKENKVGGLVNSFDFKGFTFDGGIRAIENSGIVMPMLKQLGINVEFIRNTVSIGIEDELIKIISEDSLKDYSDLLSRKFPNNIEDIDKIIEEIKKIMKYMDTLYDIDNPLFLDLDFKKDKEYFANTLLPWGLKFARDVSKIVKLNGSVEEYLGKFTKNQQLIDMIAQHFFKNSPTFFALSYFSLYLDYKYPKGGTGALIKKIEEYIVENKGEIKTGTEICKVNIESKIVTDSNGTEYKYKKLIWASDLRRLYNSIDLESITNKIVKKKIETKKNEMKDKKGGDSILTLYATVDLDKSYFENICTGHFFYTAYKEGIKSLELSDIAIKSMNKDEIINWMQEYCKRTTYEISIPVMRDDNLAPKGKSGLIISTLIDYSLVKHVSDMGWYDEFKKLSEEYITNTINASVFKNLKANVIDKFVATPLTVEKITGNYQGAITGWAFTNTSIPVERKFYRVQKSEYTPIPDVFQAGQWSFSPSGLPISIFTGKLAADKASKQLL